MRYAPNRYTNHEITDAVTYDFLSKIDPSLNIITDCMEYIIEDISLAQFAEKIAAKTGGGIITGYMSYIVTITDMSKPILVVLMNNEKTDGRSTDAFRTPIMAYVTGPIVDVKQLIEDLQVDFPTNRYATIQWWYMNKGQADHCSMVLESSDKIHDEYYPFLFTKKYNGQADFFNKFMNSNSPLLFLSGLPGTGKTSFIRSNLMKLKIDAYVGYDEKLFENDDMFTTFLSSRRAMVMIIEDCENVVLARRDGNSVMSRFLNVSDGLLKTNQKKFIFTANDSNFGLIDSALIRPGRCFDSVEFRKLNYSESVLAAAKAGVSIPSEEREYTLAEIFNQDQNVKGEKVGFY